MPGSRNNGREIRLTQSVLLSVIIAAAIIVRVAAAVYLGNQVQALPGIADQISYHNLAIRVVEGHGFTFATGWWPATPAGEPTAHWSFLYVLFLGAFYSVFGIHALIPRLIQAVISGFLQPYLTWRIGRRLFGQRVGLVSAALASFNAYFLYYSGALMTESLYIVAILWMLDISTAMADSTDPDYSPTALRTWLLLGLAMGVAALLRQMILLLGPVVIGWAIWQIAKRPRRFGESKAQRLTNLAGRPALALGVLLACILPWTIRNYRVFHEFVLLNTNAGFAFFWANHPVHGTEFMPILPAGQSYGDLIPPDVRELNEGAMDRALLLRGFGFVRADPVRYILLSISRVKEYFKFWPTTRSSTLSNYARALSFGFCVPFLVAGAFVAIFPREGLPGWGEESRASVVFLLFLSALYTLIHLLSWALIRYRLPVDAILVPFAGLAMVALYDRIVSLLHPAGLPSHSPTS